MHDQARLAWIYLNHDASFRVNVGLQSSRSRGAPTQVRNLSAALDTTAPSLIDSGKNSLHTAHCPGERTLDIDKMRFRVQFGHLRG